MGVCKNPHSECGADSKTIARVKDQAIKPLKLKFGLPYHYLLGKFGEDNYNDLKNLASLDALIGIAYHCTEMKMLTQSFDLTNSMLIPAAADVHGATLAD